MRSILLITLFVLVVSASTEAEAGFLSRLFGGRHSSASHGNTAKIAANDKVLKDVAYGSDAKQTMDVYIPPQVQNAPVIFMVHGGAWSFGKKDFYRVVDNKLAHWSPKGYILISINYRMIPEADPSVQADDVRSALAFAQRHAAEWGGDNKQFILMGHSAGAHLIALVAAEPAKAAQAGIITWAGAVLLDSGALNVPQIMQNKHYPLYDKAFGSDPEFWRKVSPTLVMNTRIPPVLAVCSTKRETSCAQAEQYAAQAQSFGTRAEVLKENLTHGDINAELGKAADYTAAVDQFIASLGIR